MEPNMSDAVFTDRPADAPAQPSIFYLACSCFPATANTALEQESTLQNPAYASARWDSNRTKGALYRVDFLARVSSIYIGLCFTKEQLVYFWCFGWKLTRNGRALV
jgi:hypothetical protein